MVVLAIGVRPNVALAEAADLEKKMEALLRREMDRAEDSWAYNFDVYHRLDNRPAIYHPDELPDDLKDNAR